MSLTLKVRRLYETVHRAFVSHAGYLKACRGYLEAYFSEKQAGLKLPANGDKMKGEALLLHYTKE